MRRFDDRFIRPRCSRIRKFINEERLLGEGSRHKIVIKQYLTSILVYGADSQRKKSFGV